MQVSIERPAEGLEYKMTVTVPGEGLSLTLESRLKEIQKTLRMDGFRPGKVPMNIVRMRYGQQVRAEALEDLLYDSFVKAANQEHVNVAGILGFEQISAKEGEDISFTTRFEVYPDISLPDMSELSVEKVVAQVSDKDIDDMIERLRQMRKTYEKVERAAEINDLVNIDFVGRIDGVEFDGGSAQDVSVVLGSGRMIPGFEDGIVGMKAGEHKTVEVTFPDDYQAEHLAGKQATFEITVNSVQAAKLPEVDAEFIKSFGIDSGDMAEFRADVKKNLERQLALVLLKHNKDRVMDALLAATSIDLPNSLVEREVRVMIDNMRKDLAAQGIKDMPSVKLESLREEAGKRVKLGLLISELLRTSGIQISEEAVRNVLALEAESYDNPQEFIDWYLSEKDRREQVEALAIENAVMALMHDKAKVTEVTKALEELIG